MSEGSIIREGTFQTGGKTYRYQERAVVPPPPDPEGEKAISEKLLWSIGVELKALTDGEWETLKASEDRRRLEDGERR